MLFLKKPLPLTPSRKGREKKRRETQFFPLSLDGRGLR